jgi:hypothetical protein
MTLYGLTVRGVVGDGCGGVQQSGGSGGTFPSRSARVLIACGDGVDHCVGVAVAHLIQSAAADGCGENGSSENGCRENGRENGCRENGCENGSRENGYGNGCKNGCCENGCGNGSEDGSEDGSVDLPPPVSKDLVRQRLADVSSLHPEARPSRGTLKQVYNFLLADQQRRLGLRR